MYKCQSCGQEYTDAVSFCGRCGSSAVIYTTSESADVYGGYSATSYTYPPPAESKAPAIMGMIFGILALFMAIEVVILGSIFVAGMFVGTGAALLYFFLLALIFMPFSIIGMVTSSKAKRLMGMATAGKITSIISLVLWGIFFIICVAAG